MEKEELVEMFCSKVNLEQKRYKKRIIKIDPEEIYNRSYEIDCMVNISEVLLEKCESMSEDMLKCLLVLPSLLHFFYSRWMKTGDPFQKELEESMDNSIQELQQRIGDSPKKEEKNEKINSFGGS